MRCLYCRRKSSPTNGYCPHCSMPMKSSKALEIVEYSEKGKRADIIDQFKALTIGGKIRIVFLVVCFIVLFNEFAICITDKILHTKFILVLVVFSSYTLLHFFCETYKIIFRIFARIVFGFGIIIVVVAAIWSPKAFNSAEMFNAGIGYASVKWFGKDLYCISNSREVEILGRSSINDVYITDLDGDEVMMKHFTSIDPNLIPEKGKGGIGFFRNGDKNKCALIAVSYLKSDYIIWEIVTNDNKYRVKDIFGNVIKLRQPGVKYQR